MTMKTLKIIAIIALLTSGKLAFSSENSATEAEVRKVDLGTQKITLKHGEIKNLDMPPMTMVFGVKEPKLLDNVKAGDRVLFTAEKLNGTYTVTTLRASSSSDTK